MRKTIWTFVNSNYPCLINLAQDIAVGIDPHPSHNGASLGRLKDKICQCCKNIEYDCPQPINYLANAVPYSNYSNWNPPVNSPFTTISAPCAFHSLGWLAQEKSGGSFVPKTIPEYCGFNTGGLKGLAILFGPWSDYCLWCWAKYPHLGKEAKPILILGKDNDTFAAQKIFAGSDWGDDQVKNVARLAKASDPSTRNLFQSITKLASAKGKSTDEFIAEKRIFIYNIWPWFRCGSISLGNFGIHSNLSNVSCLWHWVRNLIDCLQPKKVATLGDWAYYPYHLKQFEYCLLESCIGLPHLSGIQLEIFRHPSASQWFTPWNAPKGYNGPWGFPRWKGQKNRDVFEKFLMCNAEIGKIFELKPLDVLDCPTDS